MRMYVWWSKKLTVTQRCCPQATSCPIVRARPRDGVIVGSWHALLSSFCHSAEGRLRLGAPVEKGHSVSMPRSWCLERSITIYMLIFDSSLLPDAHTLVQRYKKLVLWVLSHREKPQMEELTSRSHSRMFIQLQALFYVPGRKEEEKMIYFCQYMKFTELSWKHFYLSNFLICLISNYENAS